MKTWFRIVAILFVIFLGVGLLVALKSFSVPTVTTGEFILISGTNSLIIGGIILLSLTVLTSYRKGGSGGKVTPEEIRSEAGKNLAELIRGPYNPEVTKSLKYYLNRLASAEGDKKALKALYELNPGELDKKLMSLVSEAKSRAYGQGDPSVGRLGSDLSDGHLDDPGLLKRGWYHFKNTTQSGLANIIYHLLFAYSQGKS